MKQFFKNHWLEVLTAILAFAVIHAFLLAETFKGDRLDANRAGLFGDFIGGYLGTIFLVFSVVILFGSYRDQVSSNKRVAFESRFFELLKYHRENVAEIGIDKKAGRRVFVSMIREFRETLAVVNRACTELALDYPQNSRSEISYLAFYYGVGPNSTRVLREALRQHPANLVDRIITMFEDVQRRYRLSKAKQHVNGPSQKRDRVTRLSYCPFDGHQSRLGHYYRHLYHLVKYAAQHAPNGDARKYVDLVRAQLTNHEQALLCLNSLSQVGSAWIRLGYLQDFELIKNIPKHFFDPKAELDLSVLFPNIK